MSTRWRIFLAAVVLVVLPAGILAGYFRVRLNATVNEEFERRWLDQIASDQRELAELSHATRRRLVLLAEAAADDNRLRLALSGSRDDLVPYLRDYAGHVARTSGTAVLELVDATGRILSSAHYRNEFGADDGPLIAALDALAAEPWPTAWRASSELQAAGWTPPDTLDLDPRSAFVVERTARDSRLALLASATFTAGGRGYRWIGGPWTDDVLLAMRDTSLVVVPIVLPEGGLASWGEERDVAWAARAVPLIHAGLAHSALLVHEAARGSLMAQRRQIDQLVATLFVAVLAGSFLLAAWLSGRLSRPLARLAAQAERVDLDDPAADFATGRGDEVGQLARVLDAMVDRLRVGARRLAEAEHRATLGEVSRQVNHDLRNGITPVRNVIRHLGEAAEREPAELAAVFASRRGTLDASLAYLEQLAGHYARLAPESRRTVCDLGALVRETAAAQPDVAFAADPDAPGVLADPVSLRRILENLLRNAREALPSGRGTIEVEVAGGLDPELGRQCVLRVRDHGVGMPPEVRDRVLEDFFTTRPGGSGLGLSNVRRLAGDAGGQIAIDSVPGEGTTVTITFPAAEATS